MQILTVTPPRSFNYQYCYIVENNIYLVQWEHYLSGSPLRTACRSQPYILQVLRPKTHSNDLKEIQGKHFHFSSQPIIFQGRKMGLEVY